MVKNGEIEPGHHKLGIADGGKIFKAILHILEKNL